MLLSRVTFPAVYRQEYVLEQVRRVPFPAVYRH
jgi:hypothetical protein